MQTSIFRIELAMDAKADFVRKTNPFGSGEGESPAAAAPPMKDGELDREAIAARMEKALAFFG